MHHKNLFLEHLFLELGLECLNIDFNKWYRLPWPSNAFTVQSDIFSLKCYNRTNLKIDVTKNRTFWAYHWQSQNLKFTLLVIFSWQNTLQLTTIMKIPVVNVFVILLKLYKGLQDYAVRSYQQKRNSTSNLQLTQRSVFYSRLYHEPFRS